MQKTSIVWLVALIIVVVSIIFVGVNMNNEYAEVKDISELGKYNGRKIVVEGNVSQIPWQHIGCQPDNIHREITYFDVFSSQYGVLQTVLYSKEKIACTGKAKVYGTVIECKGWSKAAKSTIKEEYIEYHIVVDKVECLD